VVFVLVQGRLCAGDGPGAEVAAMIKIAIHGYMQGSITFGSLPSHVPSGS
jgi:hypothetical protein